MLSDQIVNPDTGRIIGKYDDAWWYLIRSKRYGEDYLEALPTKINQPTILTTVDKLPQNWKPIRAGVILYTVIHDQLLFGFGLDATYNQLTDFAGGVKKGESAISAALKEFCEESLIFCDINKKDIKTAPVLYDKHHLIIFLYTDLDPNDISTTFHQLSKNVKKLEVKDIVWITEDELKLSIQYKLQHVYARLRNFLSKAGNFYDYL